jgi:hypothetical protein
MCLPSFIAKDIAILDFPVAVGPTNKIGFSPMFFKNLSDIISVIMLCFINYSEINQEIF